MISCFLWFGQTSLHKHFLFRAVKEPNFSPEVGSNLPESVEQGFPWCLNFHLYTDSTPGRGTRAEGLSDSFSMSLKYLGR